MSDEHGGLRTERAAPLGGPGEVSARPSERSSQSSPPPHSIELHIEELVLYGFEPAERYAIGEAVERELTRLFAEYGVPPSLRQGGEVARLSGGAFDAASSARAEELGSRIAQAVYGGLGR